MNDVSVRTVGRTRLLVVPTDTHDVVTVRGSLAVWPDFAAGEELRQVLAVSMLDKGAEGMDKMAIARSLEGRGAGIGFSSASCRIQFSARMRAADMPDVIRLLGRQIHKPSFPADEFRKVVLRLQASLKNAITDTGYRADTALARATLPEDHPGWTREPEAELEMLARCTLDEVRQYHAARMSTARSIITVAGDVDAAACQDVLAEQFGGPAESLDNDPVRGSEAALPEAVRTHVDLPDRPNLDVRIGHRLPLLRTDPDYLPLYVGTFILGGNFSARLMARVRDEKGLTYGINARLAGLSALHDGLWRISVTLSADRLEEGLEATMETVRKYLQSGPTEEEVRRALSTLSGQYSVGLATTAGLAATLRAHAENGFGPDYLTGYLTDLASVTTDQVREAVRRYIQPGRMTVTSAGTAANA